MKINKLLTVEETKKIIKSQKILVIAGPDELLSQLPSGNWIGGSNPYLQSKLGGFQSENLLYVSDFTEIAENYRLTLYNETTIPNITTDAYNNGIIITIMPAGTDIAKQFAIKAPEYKNQFVNPLLGWLSGTIHEKFGQIPPTCYFSNERHTNAAVCLHIQLPETKVARLEIINAFEEIPDSDIITFDQDGFDNEFCFINGKKYKFYDYIIEKNIKYHPQLIANYLGAGVNVGFIKNDNLKKIFFVGPVFKNTEYKFAREKTKDYKKFFLEKSKNIEEIKYSYSCLYNFFNFKLDEVALGIPGVYTFGEIAYQLLNITFVYLVIDTLN